MRDQVQPLDVLGAGLRHAALRQRVAAGNLANQSTPGFKAKAVRFDEAFKGALEGGRRKAAVELEGRIEDKPGDADATGNTVKLEEEVLELQDAGVQHRALARLINLALTRQRLAVGGQQ